MKKTIILIALVCGLGINICAQETSKKFDPQRITLGGGFGLNFTDNSWIINVSPQIGYKFTDNIIAGAGLSYSHYSRESNATRYSSNYAGVNLFGNFYIGNYFVATARPEIFYVWDKQSYEKQVVGEANAFVPSFVVGVGVRFAPIIVTINYDLVQNQYNPYGTAPYFSFGVMF